ncbi:MAG: Rab family GTPase [Candidatus Hodarchaeales archaeon]
MNEKKDTNQQKQEKNKVSLEDRILDDSVFEEMEELQLKMQVDLEEALTNRTDYLSLLKSVYSKATISEEEYEEEFKRYGLERAKNIENIHLISCFMNSGRSLFEYPSIKSKEFKESISFIFNAIKNYVEYKLGGMIEQISLETQTIHFFVIQDYIIAIVTSKSVPRDKVAPLAIQIVEILKQYPNQSPEDSPELAETLELNIESAKANLVQQEYTLKIILVGDGAVGKTSIRRRYLGEGFKNDYQMTIGADLASKQSSLIYSGGKRIKYLIWDLAGQPRFDSVRKAYYTSAVGALVVFDVTRPESFQNIVMWMNELWRSNGRGPVPLVVLGNKVDLCDDKIHCISEEKAKAFVKRLSEISNKYRGFKIYYLPTSAKNGLNIEYAFELLGQEILNFLATSRKS